MLTPPTVFTKCAMQIAVALVKAMKLQNGRNEAQQAEFFAKSLHDSWGVGDATCNNGLLLFLSKDDRQVLYSCCGP